MLFKDRHDAGRQLAVKLLKYTDDRPIIMALPRGGVVLGYEIAKALKAQLDVIVALKIGAPFQPEFAIGAIAPNNIRIFNEQTLNLLTASDTQIDEVVNEKIEEMNRRIELYRKNLETIDLSNRTVIIVDDGLATGMTTKAALMSIKQMKPKKVVLAVPVSPPDSANQFRKEVDEFMCPYEFPDFYAVEAYYDNFEQIEDDEVIDLLEKAKKYYKNGD